MKTLLATLSLIGLLGLSACNTIAGAGQDIQSGGQKVQEGAHSVQEKM